MEFVILDVNESVARMVDKFEMAAEQAKNTAPVMAEISADLFRIEKAIFSSGGRRGGGSWKRLKEDTIKRKGSEQILRSTDALYRSVTEPGAQFQILEVTNTQVIFGTERPWAEVHQFGSANKSRPARPFIKFMPSDITRWDRMLLAHLMEPFSI